MAGDRMNRHTMLSQRRTSLSLLVVVVVLEFTTTNAFTVPPQVVVVRTPPSVPALSALALDDVSASALGELETLAPKIGIVTATALYWAPAKAVWNAIQEDDIGDLNPLPLALMSMASGSWLAYGLVIQDPYVALSNIAGCLGSISYMVGLLPVLENNKGDKQQLRMTQGVVMAGISIMLCLWTFLGLSGMTNAEIGSILGAFASALFIILSASPLSTIGTVLATQNSASILGALTLAQCTNAALWVIYGLFTVENPFIWGPNGAALTLGLAQLALLLVFPSKPLTSEESELIDVGK